MGLMFEFLSRKPKGLQQSNQWYLLPLAGGKCYITYLSLTTEEASIENFFGKDMGSKNVFDSKDLGWPAEGMTDRNGTVRNGESPGAGEGSEQCAEVPHRALSTG